MSRSTKQIGRKAKSGELARQEKAEENAPVVVCAHNVGDEPTDIRNNEKEKDKQNG